MTYIRVKSKGEIKVITADTGVTQHESQGSRRHKRGDHQLEGGHRFLNRTERAYKMECHITLLNHTQR